MDEINKNLNLLVQYNKGKKQLKYKSKDNLLELNLFRYKNKIANESYANKNNNNNSYLNNIDNNINNNYLYDLQNKKRKLNNHIIDMNLNMNEIANNKKPFYMNHKSSRPNTSNCNRYLPTIIGNNYYKEKNEMYGLNRNKNEYVRYNIFSNYNNDNKNNYYFNNCNFINNNNTNENYIANPYNNNYLRNPYNNNYNLYNNFNQIYKEYFNNFMKCLSLRNQKTENDNKMNININTNLINLDNNENKKRKIIYEKINIKKIGNDYSYQTGPAKIKYVGGGNYYNQCHKAIIKNNLDNNFNKNYGIQNLFSYGNKQKNH